MGHSREIVVVAVVVVVVGAERLGLEGDSGAEEERAVDGAVG
jgi:Sec-independent protein translocase protein TatA